ncbi:MAG: KEOPS complex subunit Pcc1 [Candidatus Thorarchaeota archaeon]
MHVRIELQLQSSKDAEEVAQAVSPDNLPLPDGLAVETDHNGSELLIQIRCSGELKSLGATIEDIMSAIDLSLRTIRIVDETE